jgi:hypothetical protein
MMTTAHKRLDKIETFLTPKEWAIRLVDEIRSYPSLFDHFKALVKLPFNERPDQRAFGALKEQAGKQHPGRKPEDIQVRQRLTSALWDEFHTLKLLIISVNQTMQAKLERISLEAGLKLFALHSLILEEAFAQTASQTIAWIKPHKCAGADVGQQHQTVLKQLSAFTEIGILQMPFKSLQPENKSMDFPSPLEEWSGELTALLRDFFSHLAAIKLVQDKHFDGHPMLCRDLETKLTELTRTIESAVALANEYLKRRAEINRGTRETNLAIALESIKASVNGQRAANIAEKWWHDVKLEALESDAERWEQRRQEFGAND